MKSGNAGERTAGVPSPSELAELVRRLEGEVAEALASLESQLDHVRSLERGLAGFRDQIARDAKRDSESWKEESQSRLAVHAAMLSSQIEEAANASETRLRTRIEQQLEAAVAKGVEEAEGRSRRAAATAADAVAAERLAQAERRLAERVAEAWAEREREIAGTLERRVEESGARALARVRELAQGVGDELAKATHKRIAAAKRALREEAKRAAHERERRARAAERRLETAGKALLADLDARTEQLARGLTERAGEHLGEIERRAEETAAKSAETVADQRLASLEERLHDRVAQVRDELERMVGSRLEDTARVLEERLIAAEGRLLANLEEKAASEADRIERGFLDAIGTAEREARDRLVGVAEGLAKAIAEADRAQARERRVRSEARRVASGVDELRGMGRRASRREPG